MIGVRCSADEYKKIKAVADTCGLKPATYLRQRGIGYKPRTRVTQRAILAVAKAHADMNRLGNLLRLWLKDDIRSIEAEQLNIVDWIKQLEEALEVLKKKVVELVNQNSE